MLTLYWRLNSPTKLWPLYMGMNSTSVWMTRSVAPQRHVDVAEQPLAQSAAVRRGRRVRARSEPDRRSASRAAVATIMHDIYRAYDLVAHVLEAQDRRCGGEEVARYVRSLTAGRALD